MMVRRKSSEAARLTALHRYDVLDTPPEESFDRITRLAQSALGMPIVLVSLVDSERQWFKSRQGIDVEQTAREISFCTVAIAHDKPLVVNDTWKDDRFYDNPLVTGEPFIRFYAGVPLEAPDGHNIGTLCVIDTKPRTLSDVEMNILRDLSRLVVNELELRQIAMTDCLTGAQTRRGFLLDISKEIDRVNRYDLDASVIMLDIDHFKHVNDVHGHAAGDAVLRELTAICRSGLRSVDVIGRIGGEEFAILLPETDGAGAMLVAERLREAICEMDIRENDRTLKITASFGVTEFSGQHTSLEDLLARADKALYQAKHEGRNRVVFLAPDADSGNTDLSEVA